MVHQALTAGFTGGLKVGALIIAVNTSWLAPSSFHDGVVAPDRPVESAADAGAAVAIFINRVQHPARKVTKRELVRLNNCGACFLCGSTGESDAA